MDLIGIVTRIRKLEQTVKTILCIKETDPTVPQYVKDLKEPDVANILTKLHTDIGSWT